MMKPLRIKWFTTTKGTVGIGMCEDDFGQIHYKVSPVDCLNENIDANHVAAWGASLPNPVGDVLFGVDTCKPARKSTKTGKTIGKPKSSTKSGGSPKKQEKSKKPLTKSKVTTKSRSH